MVTITHTPYGQEHPYEQLPEERFPRQPLAGEPFMVGITTQPAGEARQVRVHYRLNHDEQAVVEAIHQRDWNQKQEEGVGAEFLERMVRIDQDVWRAPLVAPPFGQTLTYWVEVDGISSGPYTLLGETWQVADVDNSTVPVTLHHAKDQHFTIPNWPPLQRLEYLTNGQRKRRIRLTFACQPDERFFGLGERFNALDQRGNRMDIRVYEQYKNQGQRAYMPIPFLLSSKGYGVYVDSTRWMEFDLAASDPQHWMLEADLAPNGNLTLHSFTGTDLLGIIAQFTQFTGPVALPPQWVFGLWMSSNEWNSQARVEHEVQTSLEYGIQPAAVVIEAWSDETTFYIWNDAQYTPKHGSESFAYRDFTFPAEGKWPNPQAMIDWLHEHDIKLVLWQIPVLKVLEQPHAQHEADRAYFEQAGFGVREADGNLHKVRPFWFRGGYLWDVTNPAERAWWLGKRAYLLKDLGIDGFKTDGGEHMWSTQTRFADGRQGDALWNTYPQLYTAAYYDFANQYRPAVTFSRAGSTGSQRAPLHWAGDENSTWEAFQHSILAGLSAAVSGIPFWGWDFGGFSGPIPTAELYLRAAAMAVFCPIMQYHSEYNPSRDVSRDRTPWNIQHLTGDERVVPIFKQLLAIRQQLQPYIWREAQHSAETGEPMLRPLQLWHTEASTYQYYFGRELLVCPIVEPDVTRCSVFLPAGTWYDFWTGQAVTGGGMVEVDVPLDRIPVFSAVPR